MSSSSIHFSTDARVPSEISKRTGFHCATCGSDDVRRDASVAWDTELQMWEIVTVFDNADCEACGGETSLIEKEIAA